MKREEITLKTKNNSVLVLKEKVDRSFFTQFEMSVRNLEILNVEEQITRNFFIQQFATA